MSLLLSLSLADAELADIIMFWLSGLCNVHMHAGPLLQVDTGVCISFAVFGWGGSDEQQEMKTVS